MIFLWIFGIRYCGHWIRTEIRHLNNMMKLIKIKWVKGFYWFIHSSWWGRRVAQLVLCLSWSQMISLSYNLIFWIRQLPLRWLNFQKLITMIWNVMHVFWAKYFFLIIIGWNDFFIYPFVFRVPSVHDCLWICPIVVSFSFKL